MAATRGGRGRGSQVSRGRAAQTTQVVQTIAGTNVHGFSQRPHGRGHRGRGQPGAPRSASTSTAATGTSGAGTASNTGGAGVSGGSAMALPNANSSNASGSGQTLGAGYGSGEQLQSFGYTAGNAGQPDVESLRAARLSRFG